MIYYFFFDYQDSGHYYKIGIECNNKEEAEQYLQKYSKDVRYYKSYPKRRKTEVGTRKIPIGIIVSCEWVNDKINTFNVFNIEAEPDSRHHYG